jgi:hypothetical protein
VSPLLCEKCLPVVAPVVNLLFGAVPSPTHSPPRQGARYRFARVLSRSVLAFGCAPHAASGRALLACQASLFMRRDGSEEQILSTTRKDHP